MARKYWIARSMPLVTTIARALPPILPAASTSVEVVDHDLGLQPDRMVVALHVAAQLLLQAFLVSNSGRPRSS